MTPSRAAFKAILWSLMLCIVIILVAMILTYFAETR
jgi:hypothetical protein